MSTSKYNVDVSSVVDNNNNNDTNLNPPSNFKFFYSPTLNGQTSVSNTWLYEWTSQMDALVMKNIIILSRRICTVLLLVFLPSLFIMELAIINTGALNSHRSEYVEPIGIQLKPIQCIGFDDQSPSCITIMYGPSTEVTDDIMNIFVDNENKEEENEKVVNNDGWKIKVGVEKSSDIIFPSDGQKYRDLAGGADIVGMKDKLEISKFMFSHLGALDAALFFDIENDPTGATYTLMVNASIFERYAVSSESFFPLQNIALQNNINQAIIVRNNGGDPSKIDLQITLKPIPDYELEEAIKNRDNLDVYSNAQSFIPFGGPMILPIGPLVSALLIINAVTGEKRARLLGYMRMMGLHEGTYWISWMIVLVVISLCSGLVAAIVGKFFTNIYLFKNCDFGVHFVAWFFFLTSMYSMGLFLSSFLTGMNSVNLVSFLLLVFVILFCTIVNVHGEEGTVWNESYSIEYSPIVQFCFFMMPWFHYIRIFFNILTVTKVEGMGIEETQSVTTAGPSSSTTNVKRDNSTVQKNVTANSTYYKWDMIYDKIGKDTGEPFDAIYDHHGDEIGPKWWAPSIHDEMMYMFALTIIYIALTWYFAQIFSKGAKKKFFCLSRKYWACISRKHEENGKEETVVDGDRLNEERVKSKRERSLRVYNMSKSFKTVTALKEVSLIMKSNQVFCLLGHNGAGKTTAINCLTGLYNVTHGEVFVLGKSIKKDMTQVQKMMGVCPQEDILFKEMSAEEHLRFWARFKGVPRNQLDAHVRQTLADISLEGKGDVLASTFSGGMRRRLSVGMSAMGHPKVIFLDEPTTGLDPLSRSRIWKMIERLKKGRIIVLTTHSMEEADALSDEIAILSAGRLRAIGTSFFLKNKFGSGYSISMMCMEKDTDKVIQLVNHHLPGAETLANAAGALTFGLPKRVTPLIPGFFKYIEAEAEKHGKDALVKEWSISNTTLEEVFLRLVAQTKQVNANTGGNTDGLGGEDAVVLQNDSKLPTLKAIIEANDEELQPIKLYSTTGAPLVISDQLYRIAGRNLKNENEETEKEVEEEESKTKAIDDNKEQNLDTTASKFASEKQGTIRLQIKAFMGKDYAMLKKQKIGNFCKLFFLFGASLVLLIVHWAMLGGEEEYKRRQKTPGICSGGLTFEDEDAGGGGFDLCNETHWHDYILGGKCNYREDCSLYRNTSVFINNTSVHIKEDLPDVNNNNSSGRRFLHELDEMSYEEKKKFEYEQMMEERMRVYGFRETKTLQNDSMYPDFCVLANTMRGENPLEPYLVRLWIENKDSVVHPISMNALGNIHNGKNISSSEPIYFNSTKYMLGCLGINISHHKNIAAILIENQKKVESQSIPRSDMDCMENFMSNEHHDDWHRERELNRIGEMSQEVPTVELAINTQKKLFPDYAITFEQVKTSGSVKQKNLDMQLKYTIHIYAIPDGEEDATYRWASIFYSQGDSHDKKEVKQRDDHICQGIRPQAFVPSSYYHYHDHGRNQRGDKRPLTIQPIFLTTHILNSALYDNYKHNNLIENEHHDFQINSQITAMPYLRFERDWRFEEQLTWLLNYFPVMTMLALPGIVYIVGMELREKLIHAIIGQNGSLLAYWSAVYLFHYAVYSAFTTAFVLFQYIFGSIVITNCNFGQLFAMLIVWGYAQIGFGIFLSMILKRTRLQTLSAYLVMLLLMGITQAIRWIDSSEGLPYILWLFPPTAFAYSLILILRNAAQPHTIVMACLNMFWTSSLLGLIGIYIHYQSLYEETGTFISKYLLNKVLCKCRKKNKQIGSSKYTTYARKKIIVDSDVLEEETRVNALNKNDMPVKIVGLRKIFQQASPPKVAVDGITFAIDYDEVFSLLGPNGAGKTTSIQILSGLIKATSGNAFIGGFDVTDHGNENIRNVRRITGLCPQFDVVWPKLTVKEHLLFYARLRGVKKKYEMAIVQDIAGQVELGGDDFHRQASKLSGGMKRRLSIAIAIIGDPSILYFDEPTTGLDPETKLGVWRIIEKQSKGKAIILTTHSMEEADALSTRVGIMASGTLRCIGSQLHLKNKFGSGYKLTIVLKNNANINDVDTFVKTTISNEARRMPTEEHGDSIIYSIANDNIKISMIFEALQNQRKTLIEEWSLQQTTLESVFLEIAKKSEKQAFEEEKHDEEEEGHHDESV